MSSPSLVHHHSREPFSPGGPCLRGCACALCVLLALVFAWPEAARAGAFLTGTVTDRGAPAAGIVVTAAGSNMVVHATTDREGRFRFGELPFGTYDLAAHADDRTARARIDLASGGAIIALVLRAPSEIVHVTTGQTPPITGSGSDVNISGATIVRMPYSTSFPNLLLQLPGAARGANGVVHINGDHGVIDYIVDGVPLPQALNRAIGSEINPNDIAFLDVVEGAYPAQYGLRFGSVLNIASRSGSGPADTDGTIQLGSNDNFYASVGYHEPLAGGGGMSVAALAQRTSLGLDPPDYGSPHNDASDTNLFGRFTLPLGHGNVADITAIHSYQTFQIPNDVTYGEPAWTDDNEMQQDDFLSAQFRHPIGDSGVLTFGPAVKVSRIRDYGDPDGDFAYGEALNVLNPPFGNGGSPGDCAVALHTGNFAPTTCAFSLTDDKTAIDYILDGQYVRRTGRHEVRAGVIYDLTTVAKSYAVTLQPHNFLAPLVTPLTPNAATTVIDDAPNLGNTYATYIQDDWQPTAHDQIAAGLRYDFFTVASSGFRQGFGAFSPRLKWTHAFGPRAALYAYIGRFFEPFSFENVSPRAAQLLNLPLQPSLAQFDLKPERDTQLEFGGHVPLGTGSLGFRVWQKNANDLIDDTQVGVTLLHQDINYSLGRISQEALVYTQPLPRAGRAYLNAAHTVSLNEGCETQLLAPCFGQPSIFTPADHDQAYSVSGGVLINGRGGGWFSADAEYGSGLSSAICPETEPGYCKRTPHTVVDLEQGIPLRQGVALTAGIANLLNDRYYVTLLNAQGNHVAPSRTFEVGVRFGR